MVNQMDQLKTEAPTKIFSKPYRKGDCETKISYQKKKITNFGISIGNS